VAHSGFGRTSYGVWKHRSTALSGGSKTARYGFDFSRNVGTNLEVHREFTLINGFKKTLVDPNGNTTAREFNAVKTGFLVAGQRNSEFGEKQTTGERNCG
jgi:hypothetical protein